MSAAQDRKLVSLRSMFDRKKKLFSTCRLELSFTKLFILFEVMSTVQIIVGKVFILCDGGIDFCAFSVVNACHIASCIVF